jgi:hypothetical protein
MSLQLVLVGSVLCVCPLSAPYWTFSATPAILAGSPKAASAVHKPWFCIGENLFAAWQISLVSTCPSKPSD